MIFGGRDNDMLLGYDGDDTMIGGAGDDILLGGDGQDRLLGRAGSDMLYGESDADRIDGGAGNDFLMDADDQDKVRVRKNDLDVRQFNSATAATVEERRAQLQQQIVDADNAIQQANANLVKANDAIQEAEKKIKELEAEAKKLRDKIAKSEQEAQEAGERERDANQRADEHDRKANSGQELDQQLAQEYENDNKDQIEQAQKEVEDAERLAKERTDTFVRLANRKNQILQELNRERDPDKIKKLQDELKTIDGQLDVLEPQMLEAEQKAREARQRLRQIDPPGENGVREKANRQRAVEAQRAAAARAEADAAKQEREKAEQCAEQARQQLKQVEQELKQAKQALEAAQQAKKNARQAGRNAQQNRRAAIAGIQQLDDAAAEREKRQREEDARRFAEMHKFVDCDLTVARDDLDDVTASDVHRALWRKLQGLNPDTKVGLDQDLRDALAFVFGMEFSRSAFYHLIDVGLNAMVAGVVGTVANATGYKLLGRLAFQAGKKIVEAMKNWDPDCVDTRGFVFDTRTMLGVTKTVYNKKTGEYVTQVDVYFKPNSGTPSAREGKSFRITFAGKVSLLR